MASQANLKTVISADMTGFAATMRRAGATASQTGRNIGRSMAGATRAIGRIAKSAALAGTAIAAIGGALAGRAMINGLKNAADLGGKLSDISAQTGIAAGQLAVMQRAFEDNGISADKVGQAVNKMQRTIIDFGDGGELASRPFEAIGVAFQDIISLSPDKQFQLIQSRIAAIADPTLRAATAMQIFGRSGGEMLTLFADTGAFSNASTFLGKQSEILNRSAVKFDEISDKLGRIPAKLQGFFVGFLEPIADQINSALDRFEKFDFANLGQRISEGLKNINLAQITDLFGSVSTVISVALIDGLAKVVQFFSSLMVAVWSSEVVPKMGDLLLDALFGVFNSVGEAVNNAANWIMGFESESVEVAKSFADTLQEELDKVDWSPGDALTKAVDDLKAKLKSMFPEVNGGSSHGTSSEADLYDAELAEQRKRVAEDMAKAASGGSSVNWGAGSSNIPNSIDNQMARTGDFAGLDRYYNMQSQVGKSFSNNGGIASMGKFGESFATNGALGGLGKRDGGLGGIALNDSTGGLRNVRAVGAARNKEEKGLSLAEEQLKATKDVADNIRHAITVN